MATEKKPQKTEEQKIDAKQQQELQEKYTRVFKKIVEIIQSEENVAIVYQVLVDILTQLEEHIKKQMGQGCGPNCKSCDECNKEQKK